MCADCGLTLMSEAKSLFCCFNFDLTYFSLKRAWHKPLPYLTEKSRTCHLHDFYEIIIKIIIIFKCKSFLHALTDVFLMFHECLLHRWLVRAVKFENFHENTGSLSCWKSPVAMMLDCQRPEFLGIPYPGTLFNHVTNQFFHTNCQNDEDAWM